MNICSDLNRRRVRLFSAMPNDQFLGFTRSESHSFPNRTTLGAGLYRKRKRMF
jgi:hypothetical protein